MYKFLIPTFICLSLLFSPSQIWAKEIGDLVERESLFFEKFSDKPFSGEISGLERGSIKDGKKEKKWLTFHENGQLAKKGDFAGGKEMGAWVFFYSNGIVSKKGNFLEGKKDGFWEHYYDDGSMDEKGSYRNGQRNGKWSSYSKSLGKIVAEGNFVAGLKQGPWFEESISFWGLKDLKKCGWQRGEGAYKRNQRQGLWIQKMSDGNVCSRGEYHQGKKEGRWEFFFRDGTQDPKRSGVYKDDRKISD